MFFKTLWRGEIPLVRTYWTEVFGKYTERFASEVRPLVADL